MKIEKMEVKEKTAGAVDSTSENNSTKGKILTLLFPAESHSTEGKEAKKDKNKPPTKVIIRRLPPKLTKEAFLEEFSPLPPHDYFHFVRGDLNLGAHAFSRAYVNFLNQEDIFSFKEKYDDLNIQDERGKTYHAVVEFAPFQKIPRRNVMRKKLSKAGTLESDPKYIEFLKKLEEAKNFINNPSEYFHETESSALKTKVITTPLLEYLKRKKQKKIGLKNEIRQRKREGEREKKKAEREKKKEEKKIAERTKVLDEKGKKVDDKIKDKKNDDRGRLKDEKKELKNRKNLENDSIVEEQLSSVIPNDPAILEVVVRHSDKDSKSVSKTFSVTSEETKFLKSNESDTNVGRTDRKYSDFRTRLAEEKHRKTFYKRDSDESKTIKSSYGSRKGVPDEKGDNYNIGNCSETRESSKKFESDTESKRHEYRVEMKETKSKFRYSEQRNRDREFRQKTSNDSRNSLESQESNLKKAKSSEKKATKVEEDKLKKNEETDSCKSSSEKISHPVRRKSLETERKVLDTERKRSNSYHDVSSREFCGFDTDKKLESDRTRDLNTPETESVHTDDNSKESTESEKMDEESKKDRRVERRIRNKDRPSIEIYRPGMGKFSKQRLEQKKDDGNSSSPTGTAYNSKSSSFGNKPNHKKSMPRNEMENKHPFKSEESSYKSGSANGKMPSEVRTMTFTRSASKEN